MHLYNYLEMHKHITPLLKGKNVKLQQALTLSFRALTWDIWHIWKTVPYFFLQMFHGHAVKLLISVAQIDPLRFTP